MTLWLTFKLEILTRLAKNWRRQARKYASDGDVILS